MPQTIRIGRSSSNDYVIDSDQTVSRQHAVITLYDDGRITIRDLNSTSGTSVDGVKLTGETQINPGSKITMGNTTVTAGDIVSRGKASGSAPMPVIPANLSHTVTVGRSGDNQQRIVNADVSGHHAVLGIDSSGNVIVTDLNSSNGTYVNGVRIKSPTALRKGDQLRLASSAVVDWEPLFARGGSPTRTGRPTGLIIGAVALLVAAIAVLAYIKLGNRPWEPQKIYSHYKSSVVLILNEAGYQVKLNGHEPSKYDPDLGVLDMVHIDSDGDVQPGTISSSGTGFFISDDGKVMTNKHVIYPVGEEVKDAEKIRNAVENFLYAIARQTGQPAYARLASDIQVEYTTVWTGIALNDTHVTTRDDFIPVTPIRKSDNDEVDIAVLQTNNKTTPAGCVVVDVVNQSEKSDREIGDKVYTLGFPKSFIIGRTEAGLEANNQSGEITQERGENTYGHNITIHQGASGSPVFDAYGKFAGIIVSGYLGLSQGYNHAVCPEKAIPFAN